MGKYQVLITTTKHEAIATSIAIFGSQAEAEQAVSAIAEFQKRNKGILSFYQYAILMNPD